MNETSSSTPSTSTSTPSTSAGDAREAGHFGAFLRVHAEFILQEWTRLVRLLPIAHELSEPRLLDHVPELLTTVARVVDGEGSLAELPRVHAFDRIDRGFDLASVIDEYALLRRCALGLYRRAHGDGIRIDEVLRFNEALDQAVKNAAGDYAAQRERVLLALEKIGHSAAEASSLDELLASLLRVFVEYTHFVDECTILLLGDDGRFHVHSSLGVYPKDGTPWSLAANEGFAGRVASTRQPLALRDAESDPLVQSPFLKMAGIHALYGVPLEVPDRLVGVAHVGSRTTYELPDEARAVFRLLAARASAFIYESMLREREQQRSAELQATFDQAAVGIAHVALDGTWLAVNRKLCDIVGYSREELLARSFQDITHPDDLAHDEAHVARLVAGEISTYTIEKRYIRKDGSPVWINLAVSIVRRPDGTPSRFISVVEDIHARKVAEAAAARKAEFEQQLIGIVSHDLRNPLGAVGLSIATALRRVEDARVRSWLERALGANSRALRLISDLLDFTRARLGSGIPVSPEDADIHELAAEAVEEVAIAHPDRRLIHTREGNGAARLDRDRIVQVLTNLATNALAYSPPDTAVEVRTRADDDHVAIEIHNRGEPIPADRFDRIFEPLERGTREGSGIGLGLFIVREIVRSHGGTIALRSTRDEGTTFRVELPREPGAARVVVH